MTVNYQKTVFNKFRYLAEAWIPNFTLICAGVI